MALQWTTNPEKTAPAAADAVAVTPSATPMSGSSVGWSAWVELEASTAAAWILTGLLLKSDGAPASAIDFEAQIGVGAAASEVPVTTFRGRYGYLGYGSPGKIPSPIPLDNIPMGVRVSVRMRKTAGVSVGDWQFAVTYLEKPVVGSLLVTAQPQKCYPEGAANVTLPTDGGAAWTFSSWEPIATTTEDIVLIGAIPSGAGPIAPNEWEIQLGIGSPETAFWTIRFTHTINLPVDGPQWMPFWTPYSFIPAGTLISARSRMSAYSGAYLATLALSYLERPL